VGVAAIALYDYVANLETGGHDDTWLAAALLGFLLGLGLVGMSWGIWLGKRRTRARHHGRRATYVH